MNETEKIKTIYRARFFTKLLWFVIWTGSVCLGAFLLREFALGNTEDFHPLAYIGLIPALILVMNHAFTMMILNELRLSDDGIEVRRGGIRVATSWDNVQGFVNSWAAGESRSGGRGVYFHKAVPLEKRGLSRIFNHDEIKYIQIDCNVSLPMTNGTMKLKKDALLKTDFGQAVKHYKPNYFK